MVAVRACIVGGGLAGGLLAWRLTQRPGPGAADPGPGRLTVDLVCGPRCRGDATAASGGAVRGYEVDPAQRRLALASLAELRDSPTLRRWAGFRPGESVYLPGHSAGIESAVREVDRAFPGSVELVPGRVLAAGGWAGVPEAAVAIRERTGGHLWPGRLRDAVVAEAAARQRVRLRAAPLTGLTLAPGGPVRLWVAGRRFEYDLVVLAAGAWTPALLQRAGLPVDGLRTKSIQYSVHQVAGECPPQFVDELAGAYGRPDGAGRLLLGAPTDQWGVDPDRPPVTEAHHERARRAVRARFPALRLGPAVRTVGSADCYGPSPTLSLRAVAGTDGRVFTFTGGAGGAVKTALAASREAVSALAPPGRASAPPLLSPGGGSP